MLYELHVTTSPDVDVEKWQRVCRALGVKPLVITLDTGDHVRQIMTASTHQGDDISAATWSRDLCDGIEAAGFPVVRVKMEVPLDKGFVYASAPYHEAHVKMLLSGAEVEALSDAVSASGMHASRNTLVPHAPLGWEKWYLTARAYDTPSRDAAAKFADAFAEVTAILPSVRMEMETVISDSNPSLDEGWAHE